MPANSESSWPELVRKIYRKLAKVFQHADDGVIDVEDPVGGAIRDAKILAAFAAQSRLNVPAEKLRALNVTASQLEADRANKIASTPECISNFWIAYDEMAMEMFPLSAHSIRSSIHVNSRTFPKVLVSPTTVNAAFAIVVFVVFLALQSFWVAGKDLIERADAIEKEKIELQARIRQHESSLRRSGFRLDAIKRELCGLKDCESSRPKTNPGNASRIAELNTEYRVAADESDIASLQFTELNSELSLLNQKGRPLETLLTKWHDRAAEVCRSEIWGLLCPMKEPVADSLKEHTAPPDSTQALLQALTPGVPNRSPSSFSPGSPNVNVEGQREQVRAVQRLAEQDADRFRGRVVETRLLISSIGTYFIALMMGLLGALTYILRSVSQQLKDHTYIPVSVSLSLVRICLGAIVGVFGSMLVPNSDVGLRSLPPLIVPFVFGYGIEILFSMLDKIVNSFTQQEATPASPKQILTPAITVARRD